VPFASEFFLGTDVPSDFDPDEYFDLPEFADPLAQLIKRGVSSIPDLCDHLDDQRATSIGVRTQWSLDERRNDRPDRNRVWLAAYLDVGNDYDARHGESHAELENVTHELDQHWVTVGDLCYVAIGQIVNRQLEVICYGGENCGSIMSPTLTPELADAVRLDWSNLTANDHRESLILDVLESRREYFDIMRTMGAVRRLCFYYPRAAERLLCTLLSRRVYNESAAMEFAFKKLVTHRTYGDRVRLFKGYVAQNGKTEAIGVVEIVSKNSSAFASRSSAPRHHFVLVFRYRLMAFHSITATKCTMIVRVFPSYSSNCCH